MDFEGAKMNKRSTGFMNIKDSIRRIDMVILEIGVLQEKRGKIRSVIEACQYGLKNTAGEGFEQNMIDVKSQEIKVLANQIEAKKKVIHTIVNNIWL